MTKGAGGAWCWETERPPAPEWSGGRCSECRYEWWAVPALRRWLLHQSHSEFRRPRHFDLCTLHFELGLDGVEAGGLDRGVRGDALLHQDQGGAADVEVAGR